MTDLAITFVRSNANAKLPIFETYNIAVTRSGADDIIKDITKHGQTMGDCAYLDQAASLETITRWEKQIETGKYPSVGSAYLIEEYFDEMKALINDGCHAFIHYV